MAQPFVRPARRADVADIARIQRDTWETAYGRWLPPAVLERATLDVIGSHWTAAVTSPSPDHHVLVATEGEWTVGFGALGPSPDDDGGDTTGQILTLLVEPRWGRRGHGSRLLAACTDLLREAGARTATTWLYDRDRDSQKFYAEAGWAADGAARGLDAGGREIRELRMHASLLPAG
ncbi:MAG: GNAT family N-acetyltransferase [Mycobacteriales bacterium]